MNLAALKTEIETDPQQIGYAAANGDHVAIARLINTAPRSVPQTQERPTWEFFSLIDPAELQSVEADAAKLGRLKLLLSLTAINPDMPRFIQHVNYIFGNPSTTRSRVLQWAQRAGSRAEELGFGRVTESDVADALRS